MGYVKEPDGVVFVVERATKADLKAISEVIAHYHATGKVVKISELRARKRNRVRIKKNTSRTTAKSKA